MSNNILEILQSIGYKPHDIGKEYQMRPLFRESNNDTALCVNKNTGLWYDHVERRGGPIELLVELTINGTPNSEIAELLKFDPEKQIIKEELESTSKFDKNLPLKLKPDHSYWVGRGIDASVVAKFGGGIATEGRMANRHTTPIYDPYNDDLIGFAGRWLGKKSNYIPKWKLLGKKSQFLWPIKYNKEEIQKSKEVILIESLGDGFALYNAGIKNILVTFGVTLSSKVIQFLLKQDMQKIVIAFNNDSCNNSVGNEASLKARKNLLSFFDEGQVVIRLPQNGFNDFGEMSRNSILNWYNDIPDTKNRLK